MLGDAAFVGGAVAPLALINAAGIVAHDEQVYVFQKLRGNSSGAREFRRRLDGNKFAEQIKTPAQIINVTPAAGAVEDRAAVMKNIGAKFHRVLGKPLAMLGYRVLANQPAKTHVEL